MRKFHVYSEYLSTDQYGVEHSEVRAHGIYAVSTIPTFHTYAISIRPHSIRASADNLNKGQMAVIDLHIEPGIYWFMTIKRIK